MAEPTMKIQVSLAGIVIKSDLYGVVTPKRREEELARIRHQVEQFQPFKRMTLDDWER